MSGWLGTPGPWKLDTGYYGCKRITAKPHGQHRQAKRTELACTSGLHDEGEDAANGRGMAAVPDLVEALIDWRNSWLCPETNFDRDAAPRLLRETEVALRKAGVVP